MSAIRKLTVLLSWDSIAILVLAERSCRSYVARGWCCEKHASPRSHDPLCSLVYCLNTHFKCLKWDAIYFQQLHDSYRSYHMMVPTHDKFVKVFTEKRVHQLHVQMRCSLSHWNITHTPLVAIVWSHHFTTRTSWNTHNTTSTYSLNKWRVLDKPPPQRKPPLRRRVCKCATFQMLSGHYDSCKS